MGNSTSTPTDAASSDGTYDEEASCLVADPPQPNEPCKSSSDEDDPINKSTSYGSMPAAQTYAAVVHQHSDLSMASKAWSDYTDNLDEYPLLVKSITAFFILALADALAQAIEHWTGASSCNCFYEPLRAMRFGMFGLLGAPWSHYYFDLLDRALPPSENPFTWTTFFKVIIDQFIQAPLIIAFIIVVLDLMAGQWIQVMHQDLQDHYWDALLANWKLWLPASVVNYAFVKPTFRVLFVNIVFFVWTIILSILLHS